MQRLDPEEAINVLACSPSRSASHLGVGLPGFVARRMRTSDNSLSLVRS
jgi:hypothetical protein